MPQPNGLVGREIIKRYEGTFVSEHISKYLRFYQSIIKWALDFALFTFQPWRDFRERGVRWQRERKGERRVRLPKSGVRVDFSSSNQGLVSVMERLRGMGETHLAFIFPFLSLFSFSLPVSPPPYSILCFSCDSWLGDL
ncbi:hypothetical protein ACFX1Z_006281 [Malus domestica]